MFICMCNPFTDRDVSRYLAGMRGKVTVAGTYKACSGGESPQCGKCLCGLRDMVGDHNSRLTVRAMEDEMFAEPAKENA
jgi:bacterioferritin-associated ferredoxin